MLPPKSRRAVDPLDVGLAPVCDIRAARTKVAIRTRTATMPRDYAGSPLCECFNQGRGERWGTVEGWQSMTRQQCQADFRSRSSSLLAPVGCSFQSDGEGA